MVRDELESAIARLAAALPGAPADLLSRPWLSVEPNIKLVTLAHAGEAFELPHRVMHEGQSYRIGWARSGGWAAYAHVPNDERNV